MTGIKKRQLAEIVIHLLFWIAIFYAINSLTTSAIKFEIKNNGMMMKGEELHSLVPFSFVTLGLLVVLFYSNIFWLFKKVLSFRSVIARLAVASGWFLLLFLLNHIIIALFAKPDHFNTPPFPSQPTTRLPNMQHPGFQSISRSVLSVDVLNRSQIILLLIFLSVMGVSIAYFFLKEWAKSELIQNQLQAVQLSTEIKFLKSQVNPHFLFNTLNNLFSMAQGKGNDELADGISKLSGMMRYMIYESNEDSVPLKKEIEYLQNCIVLNKLRYDDDEAKVLFGYPDQTEGIFVAPMLFIPFVENAFKHGVSIGQSSQIAIDIAVNGKQLTFTCKNISYSFIKKMPQEKSGIGLENVKRRLALVYPGKHTLIINDADGKYDIKLEINLG